MDACEASLYLIGHHLIMYKMVNRPSINIIPSLISPVGQYFEVTATNFKDHYHQRLLYCQTIIIFWIVYKGFNQKLIII